MKEEDILMKALGVLNDALDGKIINPVALQCAESMTIMLWSSVYQERLKKEQIKDALREVWAEEIKEK